MSEAALSRVRITIDGVSVEVEQGATLAAALAAALAVCGASAYGARLSVTGERRAPLCGMGVCQECRVSVDGRMHVLACQTLCRDGQIVQTTRPR
ncbi:2Fe-2S iron-sulfur cluster-binding protein [Burkholderia sp. Ac-20365]|uniref:2Fe-2S iron-sulfur cluster-binding protein n=1 Tax=Burkholderia sp. Ac-20365 TaxID=2703897 RepID=UPI00197B9572|nr:2Fe-2S iron-sulfur cluster-binding protein [Burkholderia sp. Ac-20365]MBN3762597.1 (2Fe-2S)-binding protein [Burkholderia sp. Ac-20365]